MPICVYCKKPLYCPDCKQAQPIGQTALGCPLKIKGKLWIHVIDDAGNSVPKVPTMGPSAKDTNDSGLAMFEGLEPGKKIAQLQLPLPDGLAEQYDAPAKEEEWKKLARIEDGTLAHVPFVLTRKSLLTVEFVDISNNGKKPFTEKVFQVKANYLKGPGTAPKKNPVPTTDGTANFGTVSSGDYEIVPDYAGLDAALWEFETKPQETALAPGKPETVTFKLTRKAKVDVQILFRRKLDSDPKVFFTKTDIPVKAVFQGSPKTEETARTGTTGIASFPSLLPGNYSFEPDYKDVDRTAYEVDEGPKDKDLASGDNDPLLFCVIGLKPKLKVKIILKPDPAKKDPEVIFQDKDVPVTIQVNGGTPEEVKTGEHDFGPQKPGKYKLTIAFLQPGQNKFDFLDSTDDDPKPTEKEIELDDKDGEIIFQVEPLYQKVRFIGHCLATVAKFTWIGTAVADTYGGLKATTVKAPMEEAERKHGKDEWRAAYNGDSDEEADITKRVTFITETLTLAASNVPAKDDELKVYLIPECFFLGKYGAYQVKNIPILIEKLQKLVAGPEWRHWVFVFGTVNGHYAPGSEELGTMPEFFNLSPVIRGGCGEKGEQVKFIQKAYYSAEIMESGELADLAVYGGKEITADKVGNQFSATENEAVLGLLVEDLLPPDQKDEPLVANQTISTKVPDWANVRTKVRTYLKDKGMTHLVRDIRGLATGEKQESPPEDVEKFKALMKEYLEEDREAFFLGGPHLAQKKPDDFDTNYPTETWKDQIRHRGSDHLLAKIVESYLSDAEPTISGKSLADTVAGGLSSESWATLKSLAKAEVKSKGSITVARDIRSSGPTAPAWVQVIRELLKLHFADPAFADPRPKFLTARKQEDFRFEDYSFQIKRKAGPFLPEGDTSVVQKRKVVFGVETCADHSKGRLKFSKSSSPTKPGIDIQIIPSAGMGITPGYAAVRKEGYIFNCDGWNASSAFLAQLTGLANPNRLAAFKESFTDLAPLRSGYNPLLPHTEVAKLSKSFSYDFIKAPTEVPLTADVTAIFAYGPGALHVYTPQDLPELTLK